MKILAIRDRKLPKDAIALTTDPPLGGDVFGRFKHSYESDRALAIYTVELSEGDLVFHSPDPGSPPLFPPGFGERIVKLLTEAEAEDRHAKTSFQQLADLRGRERRAALESAAKEFGVPIA